jgi:Raf kinase inhibitor-like YbhB/YbcL family protein
MMKAVMTMAGAVALAAAAQAAPFTLSSTSFKDGAVLDRKFAGNIPTNPNCVGQNVSPQLAWSNVPAGTKSIVLSMIDPEGRLGLITNHWVAYGIPVSRTSFAEGEATQPAKGWKAGKSSQGLTTYGGPCTLPDTTWHHYTFVAIATDLEPDALPEGLTREELFEKLAGHAKASSGLVGKFRHPTSR